VASRKGGASPEGRGVLRGSRDGRGSLLGKSSMGRQAKLDNRGKKKNQSTLEKKEGRWSWGACSRYS